MYELYLYETLKEFFDCGLGEAFSAYRSSLHAFMYCTGAAARQIDHLIMFSSVLDIYMQSIFSQQKEIEIQRVLQNPILLSDSRLHLFVQTQLSPEDIEACVSGNTKYTVADAIDDFANLKRRFPVEHEEKKKENYADSDSESSSSGLEHSGDDSNSHRHKASRAPEEP